VFGRNILPPSSGRKVSQARNEHEVVDYHQSTQHYIPEDITLHNRCCENLKSNTFVRNHILVMRSGPSTQHKEECLQCGDKIDVVVD
jgi:hypothetical protein